MKVKLNCRIEITKPDGSGFHFTKLNDCKIEKSLFKIGSTAKVKVPAMAKIVKDGKLISSEQTVKKLQRGDRIDIYLGYGDDMRLEHSGFIQRVNNTKPVELECEGFEFSLRKDCPAKVFKSVSLKEVLEYVLKDTGVTLNSASALPTITLTNYVIEIGQTCLQLLQKIKDDYRLNATLIDGKLEVLSSTRDLGSAHYVLGRNTLEDKELKFREEKDVKLKVKATCMMSDNTNIEVEVGDKDGQLRTAFFYEVSSKEELTRLATEEMGKYKYSGYEGKITTFLQPFAVPGMIAVLEDKRDDTKKGSYYITGTKVSFGTSGARRTIEIGTKIPDKS